MTKICLILISLMVPSAFSVPQKAFSVTQSLPLVGARNNGPSYHRTFVPDQQTQGAQDRVSTTYHGNIFGNKISATLTKQLDDDLNELSGEQQILGGSGSHLGAVSTALGSHEIGGDFGGGSYFGNKLYNGFLESVGVLFVFHMSILHQGQDLLSGDEKSIFS